MGDMRCPDCGAPAGSNACPGCAPWEADRKDWGEDPGYPYGDVCWRCGGLGCPTCNYGGI